MLLNVFVILIEYHSDKGYQKHHPNLCEPQEEQVQNEDNNNIIFWIIMWSTIYD